MNVNYTAQVHSKTHQITNCIHEHHSSLEDSYDRTGQYYQIKKQGIIRDNLNEKA